MNRRTPAVRPRGQAGSASIELLAMIPLALIFAILVIQVGGAMWAVTSLNEAVRQGARAESLDRDGCAAARAALSPRLSVVSCTTSAPSVVRMTIAVPQVSEYVPDLTVTRTAVLP
jgi:hypothetical protein